MKGLRDLLLRRVGTDQNGREITMVKWRTERERNRKGIFQQFLFSRESETSCTFSYSNANGQSRCGDGKKYILLFLKQPQYTNICK